MAERKQSEEATPRGEFAKLVDQKRSFGGPLGEFAYFLRKTGKWWMLFVIIPLLLIGGLLVLGTTAGAPLIYALF
jgi:hypothetical protein